MRICSKCSENNTDTAKFCRKCGRSFLNEIGTYNANPVSGELDVHVDTANGTSSPNELQQLLNKEATKHANKELLIGFVVFLLGALITLFGYISASEGGTYYIFYGPIIYGFYRFARGFCYRIKPNILVNRMLRELKNNAL